jgi:hypothetical protein
LKSKQEGVFADGGISTFDQVTNTVDDKRFEWSGSNFEGGAEEWPELKITFTRK